MFDSVNEIVVANETDDIPVIESLVKSSTTSLLNDLIRFEKTLAHVIAHPNKLNKKYLNSALQYLFCINSILRELPKNDRITTLKNDYLDQITHSAEYKTIHTLIIILEDLRTQYLLIANRTPVTDERLIANNVYCRDCFNQAIYQLKRSFREGNR